MMQKSLYTLGIDGGGSKTRAVVVDAQGNERGRGLTGSANYHTVGLELAVLHIRQAAEEAAQEARCSLPVEAAWLGLAGIDRPPDSALLVPQLHFLARSLRLTNDAELVLSALEEKPGVALIAGTGSIALGQDSRGKIERSGGWGHILGDEGSGYDIGRRTLQAAAKAADGRGPKTSLLELVLNHWQLSSADEMIGKVYGREDKAMIAEISSLTFRAAREGDKIARKIVQKAARELAQAVIAVADRLNLQEQELSLALGGGILLHEADFRSMVLRHIQKHFSLEQVAFVKEPALSAACAALRMTRRNTRERMQAWETLPTA